MSTFHCNGLSGKGQFGGWKLWGIAIAAALSVFVVACNLSLPVARLSTPTPSPTLIPTLTPTVPGNPVTTSAAQLTAREVAQRAAVRMAEVETFHFSIRPGDSKPNIGALLNSPVPVLLSGIEGDVVRPDQLRARITVTLLGAPAHLDWVRYQGQMYLNNPLTGRWEKLPQEVSQSFSPAIWFSPQQGLLAWLVTLEWHMVGADEVQGVPTYHLQARNVPGIALTGSDDAEKASISMWIGKQTFLLHQVQIDEPVAKSGEKTTWLFTLSAFDRPVVITPPITE
jgi:hypothetical protein